MDDDSDDYVFDDIILDEQTLATLDQQERKFLGESSHATSTSASEPVNKRLKTNNGWMPGPGTSTGFGVDYDEMPEISLQRDGSYGVGNPVNALTVSMSKLAERKPERPSENYPVTLGHLETDFLPGFTLPPKMLSGSSNSRQPLYTNDRQKHTLNGGSSRTTPFRRSEPTSKPTSNRDGGSASKSSPLQDQISELHNILNEVGIRLILYALGVLKYIPNIISSCAKKIPRYKQLSKMRLM